MFKGASGFHAVSEPSPPVGTGGIYGGSGGTPPGTVATIGDTLTFESGNVVMGTSANLLIGLNELQFVSDKIYNDGGMGLYIQGTTAGIILEDDTESQMEWSGGLGLRLNSSGGNLWLDVTTTDSIFHFVQANGTSFDGKLGVISGLMANRTWRLPDASGTIALEGGGGIYDGSGNVPTGVVATIGDTLTFAGGNVVMGASANLLVGLNEIQFVADKIYNDSGALLIEGNTAGVILVDDGGAEMEFSGGFGLSLTGGGGDLVLNTTTTDASFQFPNANGSGFTGTLGVISGLGTNRTWRLPDATGTIALVGSSGIYGGSGTLPSSVVATLTDELIFSSSGGDVGFDNTNLVLLENKLIFLNINNYIQSGIGGAGNLNIANTGDFILACDTDISFTAAGVMRITSGGTTHIEVGGDFTTNAQGIEFRSGGSFFAHLTTAVPMQNNIYTLPDASGTIALVEDVGIHGIYGGSGNIPDSTIAEIDGIFWISDGDGQTYFKIDKDNGEITFNSGDEVTMIMNTVGVSINVTGGADATWLDIDESLTFQSSMRIRTGVAPTSPNPGDIYVKPDGLLYFNDGSTEYDLTSGGGGSSIYSANGTLGSARTVNMDSLSLGFTNASAGVSIGSATADASAILDLDVTSYLTKKGFLPPTMTNTQMLAISSPATGLIVYDTTNNQWMGYNGTSWAILG